jgi:hypothetical protein
LFHLSSLTLASKRFATLEPNDIANGGANQTIDPEFAAKYGLPLGLTKAQAAGIIPRQQEKLDAANTELTEIRAVCP